MHSACNGRQSLQLNAVYPGALMTQPTVSACEDRAGQATPSQKPYTVLSDDRKYVEEIRKPQEMANLFAQMH